ncbi:MAG: hypothetical protein A2148_04495 [Chloroflexi bacterium RBG_16_68_14]|nr:MAG: hypothetical protein A2148_04495 [Chloroflexi bacterium RBG_16_68_14]
MTIKTQITIEDAAELTWYRYDGEDDYPENPHVLHVFQAEVEPSELRRIFGSASPHRVEGVSILNVLGHPHGTPDEDGYVTLTIDPESDELLALGSVPVLLVCEAFDNEEEVFQARQGPGDKQFLAALPTELKTLGWNLVNEIRSKFRGDLLLNKKVRRYVETPDQWFTLKPQPQSKSIAITVRGRPSTYIEIEDDEFSTVAPDEKTLVITPRDYVNKTPVELKQDGGGSSRFVVKNSSQLPAALRVLARASKSRR